VEQITIVLAESAYNDLEDIETYISQDSQLIARRFISSIFDKIDQLYQFPQSGKPVKEIGDMAIRELLLNKYRIIFKIIDERNIIVLRIVHGSRLLDIEF